jgi:hypothetical protein
MMIDNYDEAMDLMCKMEKELPIPVLATKEFIQAMRKNGVRITRRQEIQIERVLYMGDEGGIGCAVRIPEQEETAVVTSLTHIRVKNDHPLAREIRAYQTERVQKLTRRSNHRRPTSFTIKPRRKDT